MKAITGFWVKWIVFRVAHRHCSTKVMHYSYVKFKTFSLSTRTTTTTGLRKELTRKWGNDMRWWLRLSDNLHSGNASREGDMQCPRTTTICSAWAPHLTNYEPSINVVMFQFSIAEISQSIKPDCVTFAIEYLEVGLQETCKLSEIKIVVGSSNEFDSFNWV